MTVTERPLLGKVEIERLSDVWEPARRNLIRSPRFIAGWVNTRSTATINNGTVTITPTEVGFFPRFEISPSHRFTVTPGTPWAVGVEIVGSPTVTHRLGVQFIDGTGGGVGPAINATGNTGRLTLDGTVPAGAAEVHVRLGLPDFAPIDQTAAFKEPIWENTPTVGPFFDGGTRPKLRRNLIRSPRFIAGWVNTRSTATINNGTVTITPTEVGFFPRFEISPSHRFTVTPGTPWAVGVEIVGSPTVTHRLGVQFFDGTGGGVGTAINATGNTGRLTLDGTVPAGAAEVYVRLGLPDFAPIDQTAAFKEPIWENTPTVGPFFDGAGGSARGYATAWEGAPDASASYLYDANQRVRWAGSADNSVSILDNSRVDFLATANAASITRGGSRTALGVKTDVGLMTFTLIDDEDPLSGGTFRPGQEVRAISLDTGQPLFTGTVVDVDAAYPLNKTDGTMRTRTTVTVADAVHQHVSTPRYGAMIGPPYYETFEQRIDRLAASALAPVVVPVEGAPIVRYAL